MNGTRDTSTRYRCPRVGEREADLETIIDALEAYELKRWPLGKEPGGKG
jgi:hypothetical protein